MFRSPRRNDYSRIPPKNISGHNCGTRRSEATLPRHHSSERSTYAFSTKTLSSMCIILRVSGSTIWTENALRLSARATANSPKFLSHLSHSSKSFVQRALTFLIARHMQVVTICDCYLCVSFYANEPQDHLQGMEIDAFGSKWKSMWEGPRDRSEIQRAGHFFPEY